MIKLGELKKNYLFMLFAMISLLVRLFSFYKQETTPPPLFLCFLMAAGESLAIIPYFIIKSQFKTKYVKEIQPDLNTSNDTKKFKIVEKKAVENCQKISNFQLILFSLLIAICEIISTASLSQIYTKINNDKDDPFVNGIIKFVEFELTALLTKLILKYEFGRHHFLGASIIFIGAIIVAVINATLNQNIKSISMDTLYAIIFFILGTAAFAFYEIIARYVTFTKSVLSLKLLLFVGLIAFFICAIIITVEHLIHSGDDESIFSKVISEVDSSKWYLLSYAIYVGSSFFYNIMGFNIIFNLGPTFMITADMFPYFIIYCINSDKSNRNNKIACIVSIIGYVIIIFGNFIYNELIILKFCGFDKFCKVNIDERALIEAKLEKEELGEIDSKKGRYSFLNKNEKGKHKKHKKREQGGENIQSNNESRTESNVEINEIKNKENKEEHKYEGALLSEEENKEIV